MSEEVAKASSSRDNGCRSCCQGQPFLLAKKSLQNFLLLLQHTLLQSSSLHSDWCYTLVRRFIFQMQLTLFSSCKLCQINLGRAALVLALLVLFLLPEQCVGHFLEARGPCCLGRCHTEVATATCPRAPVPHRFWGEKIFKKSIKFVYARKIENLH